MDSSNKLPIEVIQTISTEDASADLEHQGTVQEQVNTDEPFSGTDDYWKWEIVGVVGSALALMGIIIFASHFNNGPTPSWSMTVAKYNKTFTVTMNSILSLLSTIAKICVLIPVTKGLGQLKWIWFAKRERSLRDIETFESASRGLTGSALLMWKLKFKYELQIEQFPQMLTFPGVDILLLWLLWRCLSRSSTTLSSKTLCHTASNIVMKNSWDFNHLLRFRMQQPMMYWKLVAAKVSSSGNKLLAVRPQLTSLQPSWMRS